MSQPWPKQTSPIFISRKLYDETLSHFQRTPIFHHKRGWGFIQLPERISNKLQTIKFGGDHLECLGQGEPFEVNALIFPKLKTVILTQKPVKIDCSPSISNNIRRFLHDKALCTGDEGNPSHGGLCESFVTLPLTYQAPSNPTVYTEMEKRRVEHTKKVIETRDIKIKFPLTYDIKVVTSREKEKAVWWKRFETVSKTTCICFHGPISRIPSAKYVTDFLSALQTAVWEKRGLTLPSNSLPDLSKEWWFGRWKTYREGGDDPEMPYDGRKGRFLLQSSYQWGDFQEV